MKLLDRFLKKLNVNRNTFFTFILTLLTIYIAVDRIVEMLFMIFTGVSISYWNPILYTFAMACPAFAFAFFGSSSFADSRKTKVSIFYVFVIGFYIISLSMFVQYLNMGAWLLFMSASNYKEIVTNFSDLVRPAFCGLSLYLPLVTAYPLVQFILLKVDDSQTMYKSIWDFKGIDLSDKTVNHGPYACDLTLFKDFDNGKKVTFSELRRYQSLLVCGSSGTGKTAMVFEPMIAQDIEKKFFFEEASKELGFTALKTGIATLSAPYSNDYLNKNFSLSMLTPAFGKEILFNTFIKKMVLSSSPNIYKNLGVTYMSPDFETLSNMINVCNNYNISYNLIDPSQPEKSIGLNPFVYENPTKIAVIISSTLQGIDNIEEFGHKNVYQEEAHLQIIQNLAILLKVMYPLMNNGSLPNMEDLLKLLSNFELVEKMCKIMQKKESLSTKYQIELSYFQRSFFAGSSGFEETQKNAYYIASRLENLLRSPSIRQILCNRHTNINFETALQNGDVTFICTRRGDSGKIAHKAFGLFFLLSMQNSVLSRPGNEKTRIPHFLYIDEFADFLTPDTETIFTMYRKYKVATTISTQSISQFSIPTDKTHFNSVVLANCSNKIFTGGSAPINELEWWSNEIGKWKQWSFKQDFDGKTGQMGSTLKEPSYSYVIKIPPNRLQSLPQTHCAFKIITDGGKPANGEGSMSYLSSKYKEQHQTKSYNFAKYSAAVSWGSDSGNTSSSSENDDKFHTGAVQNTNTKYSFGNEEGAVVINTKKRSIHRK